MIFLLDNRTKKKYCLRKSIFLQSSFFDLAFHLIGYMQPHKRQKSHWMNIGTVSFSNLLHKPTPIRMHIAGTFRISLSPILQDILMKSVCMWTVGLLGLATRAIWPSLALPTHRRSPLRPCCGRSDACLVTSSPPCHQGGRGQTWQHGGQDSWVDSTEKDRHGSHRNGPLPPHRCYSWWRGQSFGRGWRVTVVLWEHGGIRSVAIFFSHHHHQVSRR